MYKTLKFPLNLDDGTKSALLQRRHQQTYFYNIGVNLALDAIEANEPIPTNITASYHLTKMEKEEWHPPVLFQRAACYQGLESVRKHRSKRSKLETSIKYLKLDIDKTKWLDIKQHKLERLLNKGTKRLYRTRKAQDKGKQNAIILGEQAQLINQDDNGAYWDVKLPGKCELPLKKPIKVEDGWKPVGAIQIVDTTRKVTRKTAPHKRQYSAHLQFKADNPPISTPVSEDEILGVDVGVKVSMAVSDGRTFHAADTNDITTKIKKIQKKFSKYSIGSRRRKKYQRKLKNLYRKKTNKVDNTEHQNVAKLLNPAPKAVAVEKLQVKNMTASAKGTVKNPGKKVSQKRGLNRAISEARFNKLLEKMRSGCERRGVGVIYVSPSGTSQNCHVCGQRGIRENQALFRCEHCGVVFNADYNAAINIRRRGWERCGRGGRTAVISKTDKALGAVIGDRSARQKKAKVVYQ